MSILLDAPEKGAYQPEEKLQQKDLTWKGPILYLTASQTRFGQGGLFISGSAQTFQEDIHLSWS